LHLQFELDGSDGAWIRVPLGQVVEGPMQLSIDSTGQPSLLADLPDAAARKRHKMHRFGRSAV
jgi:hypothetical protein